MLPCVKLNGGGGGRDFIYFGRYTQLITSYYIALAAILVSKRDGEDQATWTSVEKNIDIAVLKYCHHECCSCHCNYDADNIIML